MDIYQDEIWQNWLLNSRRMFFEELSQQRYLRNVAGEILIENGSLRRLKFMQKKLVLYELCELECRTLCQIKYLIGLNSEQSYQDYYGELNMT
jgi:hypothetical protein